MAHRFSSAARRLAIAALIVAASTSSLVRPASAQLREQIKNKVVDDVANQLVSSIQNDSCPQFEAMLKQRKSGNSNSSKASGMMKNDPAARQRFVNKVAGPLLNKMIDCNLLPGR